MDTILVHIVYQERIPENGTISIDYGRYPFVR